MLAANRYGKAGIRLAHLTRGADRHELTELTVDVSLSGDFAATYESGDNSAVLPTDTQKNTVYAFAAEHGVGTAEAFAARLARHFVASQPAVRLARVAVTEYPWQRLGGHSFRRPGGETRTAVVHHNGARDWVVSGLTGLVLLNTTGSEFRGFATDRYTTLPETGDRILATEVEAAWRYVADTADTADTAGIDWAAERAAVRDRLVAAFVDTYSRSLQQTLYAMGERVLAGCPQVCEVRLVLPNLHHIPVPGSPGDPVVFTVTDRPYGLIEGTVRRAGAPDAGPAWS